MSGNKNSGLIYPEFYHKIFPLAWGGMWIVTPSIFSFSHILSTPSIFFPSVFQQGGENGVTVAELTEQKIGLVLLEVCHKAGGSDYLRQIYHIIQGNEVRKHSHSPAIRWLLAWGRRLFMLVVVVVEGGAEGRGAAPAYVQSACSDCTQSGDLNSENWVWYPVLYPHM